ncbi:hypothetical protein BD324DRAFT_648662 [Kockovaella imperatae]|uniref:Uncharacterized protein n=1 Tax=Kockovaella imperatae TaxID=4999 RepID=A0A1Y1UPR5_9TREE|nr:hypothetical protein BD324DRAFT_648662 [Kockovaella imperatae]ORX40050.1 hypothetical protein BD324DRAFT_648662 [Kockovaella imperatae]
MVQDAVPSPYVAAQSKELSYVVVSGGTGANSIISAFGPSPAFVLPVSDDGGSSSEILRCFGGPSIGDIRSRLIRLIPIPPDTKIRAEKELIAIYNLMAFRFPAEASEKSVRELWMEIVEGRSDLWKDIGEDKKECIRAFLVHFQTLCLRRAHKRFSFRNFSLGNGFLTGARDLFASLPSAIFLFKSIASVNAGAQVIPAINTNQTVTIAAQLANAATLVGQCTISHPTPPITPIATTPSTPLVSPIPARQGPFTQSDLSAMSISSPLTATSQSNSTTGARSPTMSMRSVRKDSRTFDTALANAIVEEFAGGNISYRKGEGEIPLEAKIEKVFYINLYGQEIFPEPNPEYLDALTQRDVLVYSCGSLWTSIVPCLNLRGLATAIAASKSLKAKVVLLNTINDRETLSYTAWDYLQALLSSLRRYDERAHWQSNKLISHVVYLEGSKVELDERPIESNGIKIIRIPQSVHHSPSGETPMFTNHLVEWAMDKVRSDISH